MMEKLNVSQFKELSVNEMYDVSGGIPWVAIGIVAGGLVVFGIGVYNGYKDTKDQKK